MTDNSELPSQTDTLDLPPRTRSQFGSARDFEGLVALLLEDEPLIAMDVEMTLESAGFRVLSVMSCKDANAWLDRHLRADLVLVDIELSDGPCTEVAHRLIAAKIPFVVYSGDHPDSHAGSPFLHGIWVCKPATPDDLLEATRKAVAALKNDGASR